MEISEHLAAFREMIDFLYTEVVEEYEAFEKELQRLEEDLNTSQLASDSLVVA